MISRLLSSDFPRSRVLTGLLILIVLGLAFAPFLFPGAKALNVAAKILIFIVLVASFDLLLGYTGIFSFAHTMFFGIGAYGIAIASTRMGAGWDSLFIGMGGALALSLILSLVIGLMSLRVRALFYAMITLAVATAFLTLASQMSEISGGDDGLNFKLPDVFSPGTSFLDNPVLGVAINGRLLTYYVLFVMAVVLFLAMLRIVNSPFGRVLQAIRENDFRAEAIGYRIVIFRIWSNILGALFATLAGCMLAIWLRYNGPDTSLSFAIMINILLIIVIGGMGSMYGAVAGTTIFLLAENYLQDLMKVVNTATSEIPFVSHLFDPDRWILWLGVMFILSVYFLPMGVVGKLRLRALRIGKK
ncbi:branched-chain amino acid ABC transporter permease [Janthinobacterium sp. 17J80-10]|uniref:branched-chain amino acid ABC transporter permease n=1 Tax=Janthinobacterium sp. 17J80-10 TaxID=2497863 RepID=UPI001005918F|nr:branched-chain amino acid ABC transporter permease [Janthinobacterium sp. 17J80-10]QAU32914.1 branched-chain amino acid ABC transporter permease [Janthinobacterium sp. 17J80-10]